MLKTAIRFGPFHFHKREYRLFRDGEPVKIQGNHRGVKAKEVRDSRHALFSTDLVRRKSAWPTRFR